MAVKARFWVQKVNLTAASGGSVVREVSLAPVVRATPLAGADGNVEWAKYTPSGAITMNVSQEGAGLWFQDRVGKDIAITFDDVDDLAGE